MKKYIAFILCSLFVFTGCKGLLETESDEKLSGDEFWGDATASDVESFINSMYFSFRKATMQDAAFILYSGDLRCAPIATNNGAGDKEWKYVNFLATNDLRGLRTTYTDDKSYQADGIMRWKTFYEVIQQANILLQEISRPNLPELQVNQYRAESIFMRSLAYFFLVRNFGDVPYYTNAYNQVSLPRTNMITVLQNISADLQQLIDSDPDASVLPWTYANMNKKATHASRASVLALLMHVNMWLAGFDSDHATEYYQKTVDCGKELVENNGGAYSLLPIEQTSTLFKGSSSEGIFEIAQNISYSSGSEVFKAEVVFSNQVMYTCFNEKKNPNLYYTYDFMTKVYPPTGETEDADQRVKLWFDENAYSTMGTEPKEITKFKNVDTYDGSKITSNSGNQIVFRLADAILLYAEALADLGTDDAKACELLNTIRTRAKAVPVQVSGQELKDYIYWERVRELIGEGHYFYDLVRTGKVCDANYCFHPITRGDFKAGAWTWPISRSALTNNTNISLNLFWE